LFAHKVLSCQDTREIRLLVASKESRNVHSRVCERRHTHAAIVTSFKKQVELHCELRHSDVAIVCDYDSAASLIPVSGLPKEHEMSSWYYCEYIPCIREI